MCAIFGYIARRNRGPDLRTLQRIAAANVIRGPHAFGFAWIDVRGILRSYRQTGRITDALGVLAFARDARMLIGHLRFATHGPADENINNHPHPCDGGWIVHNGVLHNYDQLLCRPGLYPSSECDSELLAQMIEAASGALVQRVRSAVIDAHGNLAALGLWARPNRLIAVRRGNPLHLADGDGGAYLATLEHGLPGPAQALKNNQVLAFSRRGRGITCASVSLPPARSLAWSPGGMYRGG